MWHSGRVLECSHEERGLRHSVMAFKIFLLEFFATDRIQSGVFFEASLD